jgi:hypothetical protein
MQRVFFILHSKFADTQEASKERGEHYLLLNTPLWRGLPALVEDAYFLSLLQALKSIKQNARATPNVK